MHIYDYIIIGAGLSGLSIAQKISKETDNILVLEAQEQIGGSNHAAQLKNQKINNGLRFFPAHESAIKTISFLEEVLNEKVYTDIIENTPETYESSGFKKFVGFGDKSVDFYTQFSYFLSAHELKLISQPYEWVQTLKNSLSTKILTKSIVTRFGFEGLDSEHPTLTHVVVNGSKSYHARHFIFAGPVKELGLLLPDDVFNARAKAKLKKSQAWHAVCVDFAHKHTQPQENIFVLNGTTDDDIGPCVGRFLPSQTIASTNEVSETPIQEATSPSSTEPTLQISQWLSFIDSELAEDTENIGLVLKKIKRQIKRAFPEVADSFVQERICISPALSGSDLKLNANQSFPKINNLWIASPQVSITPNLMGALQQAQLVLAALGFVSSLDLHQHQSSESAEADTTTDLT